MLRRSSSVILLCAGLGTSGLGGCATAQPTPPPTVAALRSPDDDVVALKERVTRLERRLADMDAKLGLLLAQRSSPRTTGPSAVSRGAREPGLDLGPRDLIIDEPSEEASLGARSIDLGARRSVYEEPAPEPEIAGGNEDDGSAPVVIRLRGTPDGAPQDGGAAPAGSIDAGPPAGATVEESYAWAQDRLREGRHLEAIAALEDILARNGAHDLADNSMYWVGWAHAERGNHKLSVDVWQRLPMRFPKSPKVPDALFGMAASHEAMGEPAVAETLYEQLISQYPKAEKVKEAKKALQRLRPR